MNARKKMVYILALILVCMMFAGCSHSVSEQKENDTKEPVEQEQTQKGYEVDYLKISPMIEDNVEKEVIDAALNVIEAFLNYENKADIVVSGNKHRFLNNMGYVINSTCPMFSALTNYSEMTSYNDKDKVVEWEFYVSQEEFEERVAEFTKIVEGYLGIITKEDSDAMKAILLYCEMIQNASYDYEILGDAYETMDEEVYRIRESSYGVLVNKKGICTNLSQALMFLYTQADLTSGTVLHQGGAGSHMWVIVQMDGQYYYCDPTWDVGTTPKTFGITAIDRSSWAGEYAKEEGRMFATIIEQKYDISDERFVTFRQKVPAEITDIKVDKVKQTITFEGHEYEYTYNCIE